ncbi:MAG: NAD-dependent epimerase/dehydratase family protein, partial [Candidatus Competibacterales bacterium]
MKHIMITGAHGLVGYALTKALVDAGQPVLATDLVASQVENTPIHPLDVLDVEALRCAMVQHQVSGVVHCGGVSGPMVRPEEPLYIWRVNALGTANVFEAARLAGVERVVYCSSTSAYGQTPPGLDPIPEDVPLAPSLVYSASKGAGELLARAYTQQFGLAITALRLSWVYGPRRTTACFIRDALLDALDGRPTVVPHGKHFGRQYLYVDDAVQAIRAELAAPTEMPQGLYTITGGSYKTLEEVAQLIHTAYPNADIQLVDGPVPRAEVQGRFDLAAATRDFGYRPTVTLPEGIRRYGAWLMERRRLGEPTGAEG